MHFGKSVTAVKGAAAHQQGACVQVVNVTPRYAKMRDSNNQARCMPGLALPCFCWEHLEHVKQVIRGGSVSQVMGWENIELISDRPLGTMLDEFRRLKLEFPDRQAPPGLTCSLRWGPCSSPCSR